MIRIFIEEFETVFTWVGMLMLFSWAKSEYAGGWIEWWIYPLFIVGGMVALTLISLGIDYLRLGGSARESNV